MAKKVLVLEDDPDIMSAIVDSIEREGFEVAVALDISIAEALVRNSQPDIAIIDYALPDGTGDEFVKKLSASGKTRIIMFSGAAQREIVLSTVNSGAIDYVLKGSGLDELVERVKKHAAAA